MRREEKCRATKRRDWMAWPCASTPARRLDRPRSPLRTLRHQPGGQGRPYTPLCEVLGRSKVTAKVTRAFHRSDWGDFLGIEDTALDAFGHGRSTPKSESCARSL